MNVLAMTSRLTADPARKETDKGVVTTFRIGSDGAPRVWLDVEVWDHLAAVCAAYLARGRHVAVVGSLARREWTNGTGGRHERWLLKASAVTFIDRPRRAAEPPSDVRSRRGDEADSEPRP